MVKLHTFTKISVVFLISYLLLVTSDISINYAQTIDSNAINLAYDKYQDDAMSNRKDKESIGTKIADLPAWPIVTAKKSIEKGLIYIEEHHIIDKIKTIYKNLTNQGIYPKTRKIGTNSRFGSGVEYVPPVINKRDDITTKFWSYISVNGYEDYGSSVSFNAFLPLKSTLSFKGGYKNYRAENFFGLGRKSSLTQNATYGLERSFVEMNIKSTLLPLLKKRRRMDGGFFQKEEQSGEDLSTFDLNINLTFENVNTFEGNDNGKGVLTGVFPDLPGLEGGDAVSCELSLLYDTTNKREEPARGGYEKIVLGFYDDIDGYDYGFATYKLDIARFFTFDDDEKTIAVRLYAEQNEPQGNDTVPFYKMARLGGNEVNTLMRGYQANRFFDNSSILINVEYRYNVWTYRDMNLDGVVFFDTGEVVETIEDVDFGDFREAYGIGFRMKVNNKVKAAFDIGYSGEGIETYFKLGASF